MTIKHIVLAGVAITALSVGAVAAQADTKAEEDAVTAELNLDQLDAARADENAAPAPDMDTSMEQQSTGESMDGQGGPYYEAPPEGMYEDAIPPAPEDESAPDSEKKPEPYTY
mgnify:CR=1 FL=1